MKARATAITALKILLQNLGLREGGFVILPAVPQGQELHVRVRNRERKNPRGAWRTLKLRPATSDWAAFVRLFVHEDYRIQRLSRAREIFARYEALCAAGQTPLILDIGANIGLSVVYFREVFPSAKIVAIEPESSNFSELEKNAGSDQLVVPIRAAIASRDGFAVIEDEAAPKDGFRTRIADEAASARIPALSVKSILADKGTGCVPFLIKIDIEGFEAQLFSENFDWIDDFPLLIIELHDWMLPGQASSGPFLSAIAGRSRDFVYISENVFSIRNDLGNSAGAERK